MTQTPIYFDMVLVNVTGSPGTNPMTLGTAVQGFQTPGEAGVSSGTPVSYRASDGTNWETAHGILEIIRVL